MERFGYTRSVITRQYAVITPDSHIQAPLPGYEGARAITHISPQMGADFAQLTVELEEGGKLGAPLPGIERFLYLLEGTILLSIGGNEHPLEAGDYAYLPAGTGHGLTAKARARAVIVEKRYQSHELASEPEPLIGHSEQVVAAPYLGDADARLQVLLPDQPSFDMAVNIFTFQPGAAHPFVEVHVMEHGLLMLDGGGIYRLGQDWYPVQAGDIIWMGPYCAQWFCAVGKQPARYLYYKDVNREARL